MRKLQTEELNHILKNSLADVTDNNEKWRLTQIE